LCRGTTADGKRSDKERPEEPGRRRGRSGRQVEVERESKEREAKDGGGATKGRGVGGGGEGGDRTGARVELGRTQAAEVEKDCEWSGATDCGDHSVGAIFDMYTRHRIAPEPGRRQSSSRDRAT